MRSVRAEYWASVRVLYGSPTHLGTHKGVPVGLMAELSVEGDTRRLAGRGGGNAPGQGPDLLRNLRGSMERVVPLTGQRQELGLGERVEAGR